MRYGCVSVCVWGQTKPFLWKPAYCFWVTSSFQSFSAAMMWRQESERRSSCVAFKETNENQTAAQTQFNHLDY